MPRRTHNAVGVIYWIVSRLHVGESDRAVIRFIRRKTTIRTLARKDRHRLYRHALQAHAANRDLYARVMRGSF